MAWTRANLRARFRTLTGRGTTTDISDDDCNTYINEYLQHRLPIDACLDRMDAEWTLEALATDDDDETKYTLSEDILALHVPIFANDMELAVYQSKEDFWRTFSSEEQYITAPTLVIGTSSEAAVANSAFKYMGTESRILTKAAAETALSGDSVPQSKYGAWFLEIDDDGTIAVQEAADNATGYDSAALAIDDLPGASSGCVVMGFVTAINTAAAFVPGTTLLSAATVTDTYTDGHPGYRGQPMAILVNRSAGRVYLRPRPDDTYLIKSMASLQRPSSLSAEGSTLPDEAWGPLVALGAALDYLNSQEGEDTKIAQLDYGGDRYSPVLPGPGSFRDELARVQTKHLRQIAGRQIQRSF
jgi:hypothetical protein